MLVVAVPLVAILLAGAVYAWQQVPLHLLVGLLALAFALLPDRRLRAGGHGLRIGAAFGVTTAALLVGLVPLPRGVLAVVAPGIAAARPDAAWWTLSLAPERTIGEVGLWITVGTYAVVLATLIGRGSWARTAELALMGAGGLLATVAVAHAVTGADRIFGVLPVAYPPDVFFAPFVNVNFLGSVLLLALPIAVHELADGWGTARGWAASALVAGFVGLAVAIGSPGTLVGLGVQGVLLAGVLLGRGPAIGLAVVEGLVGLAGFFAFRRFVEPDWDQVSLAMRLDQWRDLPALIADHWLAGVGRGAHLVAYPPYRVHDGRFGTFHHVHSDPLQWIAETGLVGVLALGAAIWLLPRATGGFRRRFLTIGLAGFGVTTLWNFPLQVPGLLLAAVAVLVVRLAAFDRVEASPGRVRALLFALAALQLPLAGWTARTAVADAASDTVLAHRDDAIGATQAADRLRWAAPWRAELGLFEAWEAEDIDRADVAIAAARGVIADHPHHASTLRRAGLVLWRQGQEDEALDVLRRATDRDPNDYRTWVALSRMHETRMEGGEALATWTEAMRHWPEDAVDRATLRHGYALAPIPEFWLDALADAPGIWSHELALLLLDEGEPELALTALRQAARLDPPFGDSAVFGRVLLALERPREAERHLRRVLARHPERAWVWRALGDVLTAQEQHDAALDAYLTAFERSGHEVDYALLAISAATRAGGVRRGQAVLQRVSLYVGRHPGVGLAAAELYQQAGRDAACLGEITSRHLLDEAPRWRDRARRLWRTCGGDPNALP